MLRETSAMRQTLEASEGHARGGSKIVTLEELAAIANRLRTENRQIVLCHGCFDLVHVGHLRHFKAARDHGDALVVTITADNFVNKGPDRPVFSDLLRSEFLASLEMVDYVAVVHEPSARPAIEAVRPAFYAKGSEYSQADDDITGKIVHEKDLVEKFGGTLIFTDDITYSSSNLLNKHFAVRNPAARDYLEQKRGSNFEDLLTHFLDRIADMKVLLVGETIIDRYVYVAPMGKASKENIIATLHQDEEAFAGGAVAAANHLAAICPNVELVTSLGDANCGENYEQLVRDQLHDAVVPTFLYKTDAPTVEKTRFVEPTHVRKLFEVYRMDDSRLEQAQQAELHTLLSERFSDVDLVVACDFGHGLISKQTADLLGKESPFLAINVQSNAGNIGYNLVPKYHRADFLCIDAMEARLAAREKHADVPTLVEQHLPSIIDCDRFIVTHGKSGCFTSSEDRPEASHIPAFSDTAIDTVGAGDAFFVMASSMVAAGADCPTAGFLGNVAGAIKIGIVGHRRYINRLEILRSVKTLLK